MPIRYELRDGIVLSTFTGFVSGDEMVEHIKLLLADTQIPSLLVEVVDLSHASADATIGRDDARKVASHAKALLTKHTAVHTIIVAPADLIYGLARLFEAYHNLEAPRLHWHIVHSQEEVQTIIESILSANH